MVLLGNETGLIGWWDKMDEKCIQSNIKSYAGRCLVFDRSPNSNHLTLRDSPWLNLETHNWDFCCFWWGIGTAFKVDYALDDNGINFLKINYNPLKEKNLAPYS